MSALTCFGSKVDEVLYQFSHWHRNPSLGYDISRTARESQEQPAKFISLCEPNWQFSSPNLDFNRNREESPQSLMHLKREAGAIMEITIERLR